MAARAGFRVTQVERERFHSDSMVAFSKTELFHNLMISL
jgi:hypothetical protein